jgi:hypothetical protein
MNLSRCRFNVRPAGHYHASRSAGRAVKVARAGGGPHAGGSCRGVQLEQQQSGWRAGPDCCPVTVHLRAGVLPGRDEHPGARSLPGQTSQTLPAFPAFYDAHKDVVVVSDAYPKAAAGTFHANYAPSLSAVQPASQPAWYIVRGPAATGQLVVLGSEPGESDYSPLWQTVIVRWHPGVTPQLLTSDNMILDLAKKGQLTATKTAVIVNATIVPKT